MKKTRYDIINESFVPQYIGVTFKTGVNDIYNSIFDNEIKKRIECCYENNNTQDVFVSERENGKLSFNFNKFNIEFNVTAYQFFQINCEKDTDIVIVPRASSRHKVWVNYNYYSYLRPSDIVYTIHLTKGINTIVFELPNATQRDSLLVRISTLE